MTKKPTRYTPPPKLCLAILYTGDTYAVCLECRDELHDHADATTRAATPRETAHARQLFVTDPTTTPNAKDVP